MPNLAIRHSAVLRYSPEKASRGKVRRAYASWRIKNGLPARCDNPGCRFHTDPLKWNGKPLPLILDHENGNNRDNQTSNLRYLCPNCDAQLPTRGGANRGRVQEATEEGFTLLSKGGARQYHFLPKPSGVCVAGHATVIFASGKERS